MEAVGLARAALGGASQCGDDGAAFSREGVVTLCLADGLGHGEHAAAAAKAALSYVEAHVAEPLPDLVAGCDAALRRTRGCVMGICRIDPEGIATFAVVGNIQACVYASKHVRLPATPGIVGAGYHTLLLERVALRRGDLVLLATDGLKSVIDLSAHASELAGDLQSLADAVLRRWSRGTDDAAVLLYRRDAPP